VAWIDTSKLFVCIGGNTNTEWAKDTENRPRRAGISSRVPICSIRPPPECWKLKRMPYYLEKQRAGSFARAMCGTAR